MKKMIFSLAGASLLLASCGRPIVHQGKEYPTYGFLNEDSSKSDKMCYEVSVGNVIWSIILIETLIMPIYFVGFSLFNPVGPKNKDGECGIDI